MSQMFLFADPFWLRKITTDPHILSYLNIVCPDDRYPKLKIYLITDSIQLRIHTGSVGYNAVHELAFIKLMVARIVVAGCLLAI
jgi:hypothetical protein